MPQQQQLHWDQHLAQGIRQARASGGLLQALGSYIAAKLSGQLQARPPQLSDILWSSMGMGATIALLALIAAQAAVLPFAGPLHQQGLPLLLGSFGTFCVLLFARPESAPVRPWCVVAGQLASAAVAVAVFKALGTGVIAKASAMALACAVMMQIDAVHPPGGKFQVVTSVFGRMLFTTYNTKADC